MDQLKNLEIVNIREQPAPEVEDEVVAMWREHAGLEEQEARRRLSELLLVCRNSATGDIAGVCTSWLSRSNLPRLPLWHFRTFVRPHQRRAGIALKLLMQTRTYHEKRFVDGIDRSGVGLYVEVENPVLKKQFPQAVWPRSGMVYVGRNPRGDHCRVFYFEGALVAFC